MSGRADPNGPKRLLFARGREVIYSCACLMGTLSSIHYDASRGRDIGDRLDGMANHLHRFTLAVSAYQDLLKIQRRSNGSQRARSEDAS